MHISSFSLNASIALRLVYALDVSIHRQFHVAVAENRLDVFVVNLESAQVRCEPAAESVPAMPAGQGIVAPEFVALGLVFFLGLSANPAMAESGGNRATSEVKEVQRLSVAGGDGGGDETGHGLTRAQKARRTT